MQSVCVYCASSTQIDEKYFRAAEELGTLIAQRGLRLITGAGRQGLMKTVQDAALAAGGEAIGVI
ncbi:MAG: TIGR00730 family Rossman fold protein, partial [Bacteroidaceae bacterium]|nr:TIGR00730 family Rossman fold protein [Bacteroidaceae bacterium]